MNRAKRKQIIKRINVLFVLIAVVIMSVFGGGFTASTVYAASNDVSFDDTYVMDDLESMTIDGKAFDITDYGFDESRSTNIIMFVEYCYSYYANQQGNYGLYVYVWNPKGLNIDVNSSLNMITLGFDSDYSESYTKYHLEFLSMCEETNYVGLFYKFKVYLSDSDKTYILNRLDSSERFYHVSEIELLTAGDTNATSTTINLEYRFSGYAAGYGNNNSSESTLVCNTEQGEVLTLDVQSTYYRPQGTLGGHKDCTQDTLHSVYFSVPNSILEQYGELAAVHATWLNAQTTPIFVTGNSSVYDGLLNYVGCDIGSEYSVDIPYGFVTDYSTGAAMGTSVTVQYGDISYNFIPSGLRSINTILSSLNYIFYAGSGTDSADSYTLSSEDILAWLESYTANFGGDLVNDKYSSALFAQVDSEFTDVTIYATDEYNLTSIVSSQSWWQKIWNTSTSYESTYEMSAIQQVTLSDMDNALSITSFCDSFYVAESDYDDLYSYVKEAESNDETVFLFRYYQSEYYAAEATEFESKSGWLYDYSDELDTNAYVAQMWVQLDFDIIDVTFTNGGVDTIIPVAMSPVDLVADATAPVYTTSDDGCGNWESIVMVLALLVLLIILLPVLPYIVKLVVWIICLPFKAIAAIYKAIKSANKRRRSDQ